MQPWDRQEVHTLFDGLEFRVLRDRLFETLESEEEIDDSGFELAGDPPGAPARWPAGWPSTAATAPGGRAGPAAPGGAGTGEVWAVALAAADGAAAWLDAAELEPRGRRGAGRVARRPRRGPRCCTTPRGRCWRWPRAAGRCAGLVSDTALAAYLVRPDQRSYDLADLTLRYLKRELKQERGRRPGQLSFDALDDDAATRAETAMLHARAVLDLAEALDEELEERGGTRLLAEVELPLVDLLAAHGADRHRRRRRPPRVARVALRRPR